MSDRSRSAQDTAADNRVIPIVEEQALILRRKTLTDGVRVRTSVREEDAVVEEPIAIETIEVERLPLDRWVDGPVPVRQEGDTMIITLLEEVMVVEKRLRATEEVRITKRRSVETSAHAVTLRREDAVIERITATNNDERDPS